MKKSLKSPKYYRCDTCDYVCTKPSDFNKHLSTRKHKRLTNPNMANEKTPTPLVCKCGKAYNHMSSLCKHKKTCSFIVNNQNKTEENISNNKDVMIEKLVEELTAERAEKSEMKSMFMVMMEKYKEMQVQNNEKYQEMVVGSSSTESVLTEKQITFGLKKQKILLRSQDWYFL